MWMFSFQVRQLIAIDLVKAWSSLEEVENLLINCGSDILNEKLKVWSNQPFGENRQFNVIHDEG